jgi:hypothetical protein
MINTTVDPDGSNSALAFPVLFKMIRFAKIILPAGLGGLALGLLTLPAPAAQPVAVPANLPLYFEAGQGQANVPAQFIARGHNYQFLISPTETQIVLRKTTAESAVVRMQFVGANAQAPVSGDAELPGKINHLTGNDPAQWRVGLATFAKVRVGGLYPGVNLVYYGNQQQLEYDFDIAPGANPQAIAMHFDGVDKISIAPQGELILSLAGGEIRQPKPVIYQTIRGVRRGIAGDYRLVDTHTVAFTIGQYDRSRPLVIDPLLSYSTYIGGSAGDTAWAVTLDTNGNVYIAGQTFSKQFSTNESFSTAGAFQTNFAGGKLTGDAFVSKLDAASGYPVYITYLGGSNDDGAVSIAVDGAGNAYVTGFTDSPDFPVTNSIPGGVPGLPNSTNISGTFSKSFGSYPVDAFVTELGPSGSNLVYSTYLGGSGMDSGMGIAVDSAGNAYVTGVTYSTNFPVINAIPYPGRTNLFFDHLACTNSIYFNANAFITKIGPGGTNLVYSSYFGGTNFDEGKGIAVDNYGNVYVTGFTASTNFPTLNAVVQQMVWTNVVGTNQISITNSLNGYLLNGSTTNKTPRFDAFVAKFDSTGTNLLYSTFLGGTNNDVANGIAVDTNGNAYVTGWTTSTNFPNTAGLYSFVSTNISLNILATNVFLTKITNAIGTTNVGIAWSAVFGGEGADIGYGVAVDPAGNVFVTGSASSTNFPTYNVPGLMSSTNSGKSDAFVIAFTNTTANTIALLYSGYLGGKENDFGYGIAVDANDNAYVVGQTLSTNFPTFNGEFTSRNGTNDAFLTKIMWTVPPPEIGTQPISQTNAVGSSVTFSISGTTNDVAPPYFFQWQDGTNLVTVTVTNVLDGTTNVVTVTNLMDGENISGATNITLTITNAQMTNSGFYYQVIVTNYGGSVTSSPAFLWVTNVPPEITLQPISQTNGVGTTVTLAVTATGTVPLSYQWQDGTNLVTMTVTNVLDGATNVVTVTNLVDARNISSATNFTLTITNVQTTNSGFYYQVIVTNFGGSVTSSVASLTVLSSPEIFVQPIGQTNAVGSTAAFTVTAIGTVPLRYQWWVNGTNLVKNGTIKNGPTIKGATTNVLIISNVQTNNSGNYTVVITNIAGSVTSSNAFLKVTNVPPTITLQPTSQTNGVGTTVKFAVTATGTAPFFYQWQVGTNLVTATVTNVLNGITNVVTVTNLVNGENISGATTTNLTIKNVQTTNGGYYQVIVINYGGSVTSSVASLTVLSSPVIFVQPIGQTNAVGSNVSFTVTAIGTVPLKYQWWLNGTNLVKNGTIKNGSTISGATTTNLTIKNAQTNNSGNYTVVVTNIAGSVTSSNAFLKVTNIPPAITVQPTNMTVGVGSKATFAVTATGTAPLSYQWQVDGTNLVNGSIKNGAAISGATTANLTIKNAQTNNSGNYTVIVTNYGGSVTSSNAFLTVASLPMITVQPTNQALAVGSKATFTVTAVGTAPLSYQWQVNGTNLVNGSIKNGPTISGATTASLTIKNAQTNNSGNYTVVVTNIAGTVTSSNAVLTVASSPVIVMQPSNQAMAVGATATFTVTAVGTAPLSYQWRVNGMNLVNGGYIGGATTNVLTISNAQTTNSGSYTVIVANSVGSVTSSNALLMVTNVPPGITVQPTSQTVAVGSTVTFSVYGTGTSPFFFQWQKNGTDLTDGTTISGSTISGSTNFILTITDAQTNDSGNYVLIVTNYGGSVTSSVAVLTVASSPVIVTQPTNQVLAVGSNATFAVTAVGILPLSYQWQVNGTNLVDGTNLVTGGVFSGSTSNVLTITDVQTNDSGDYTVIVTNIAGSVISSNAVLTVATSPVIVTQPTNQAVALGSNATFAVTAVGISPLSYQWQTNGVNLTDGGGISGSTNNVLTITDVQTNNSGTYTVVITNIAGSATSSNAVLTVAMSPVIVTQPTNQVLAVGSTATLAVAAIGILPLSYQWQTNGVNLTDGGGIGGSTNNVLTITDVQTNNSGTYTVIITNIAGMVTSSNAVLTVASPPVIEIQPTNQAMAVGSTAILAVTAVGTEPLNYQWQINGTNLVDGTDPVNGDITSGSTTNMLTISNAQTNNSGNYTVIVTNIAGSVTSSNAVLTVTNMPPTVTVQPMSQTVAVGTTVTFSVYGTGTSPFFFQWQKDGANLVDGTTISGSTISGSTNYMLTISDAQMNDSGNYLLIVTNYGGSVTSSVAVLTVASSPVIVTQPTNQVLAVGSNATFTVTAVGILPLSYQWQVNGTNLVDGTNLVNGDITSGSTTANLIISNVQTNNSATNYTVIVTNIAGSATSSNAILTVMIVPSPSFGNIIAAGGGGFILSGSGGGSNGIYYVLTSSNLLLPLTNWTPIATNQFDSEGDFIFTNTAQTNAPQEFYLLQMQ